MAASFCCCALQFFLYAVLPFLLTVLTRVSGANDFLRSNWCMFKSKKFPAFYGISRYNTLFTTLWPLDPILFHMYLTHNTLNNFQGPFQYYLHIYVLIRHLVRSFLPSNVQKNKSRRISYAFCTTCESHAHSIHQSNN